MPFPKETSNQACTTTSFCSDNLEEVRIPVINDDTVDVDGHVANVDRNLTDNVMPNGNESEENKADEASEDTDNSNDNSTKNVTLTPTCQTYSQDSLAPTDTDSIANSTHDCWIEDGAQVSQQSEYDRQ